MASLPDHLVGVVGSATIVFAVASIEPSMAFAELTMVSMFELAVLFVKLIVLRVELAVLFVELAVLLIELAELLEFPALLVADGDLKYLFAIVAVLIPALSTLYLYQMVFFRVNGKQP